jgi:hypothetical protein
MWISNDIVVSVNEVATVHYVCKLARLGINIGAMAKFVCLPDGLGRRRMAMYISKV